MALLCMVFAVSCAKKTNKKVVKPEFTDIQVDVTDMPSAFSIGTYTLKSVKVNGDVLEENMYIVSNGYFIFAVEYYGELGVGENLVEVEFKQGTIEFTVSVVDGVAPIYVLPEEDLLYASATEIVSLPYAYKEVIWQDYEIKYTLLENEEPILSFVNPDKEDLDVELETGLYNLEIEVVKNQEILDSFNAEIYVNHGENLLSEQNIPNLEYDKAGLELSFDSSINGLKIYKKTGQYGIESRVGIDYDVVKTAIDGGAGYLFFRYYSENGFFYDATGNPPRYLNLSLGYFSEQTGSGNVGAIADVSVNPDDDTSGSWQTAIIPITENELAQYLNFLVFACSGENFYMRDMYLLNAEDPVLSSQYVLSLEKNAKLFVGQELTLIPEFKNLSGDDYVGETNYVWESSDSTVVSVNNEGKLTANKEGAVKITLSAMNGKYIAESNITVVNITSVNYASLENFNKTTSYFGGDNMTFVESESAIKVTKSANNISGNFDHIDMPIMDEIRSAKAVGMKMLSFEYKAENLYGQNNNNPIIWVMATDGDVNTIGSACWLIPEIKITESNEGTWNKVVVVLDNNANIDNENYEYLVLLVGGDAGGTVMFRNIKYGTQQDYDAYMKSIQILTLEESKILTEGDEANLVYSFTNLDGSAYEGDAGFVWTSSDSTKVTVDNTGKITAVAVGDAVITLTALNGKYSAECTVIVESSTIDYTTMNYASASNYDNWNGNEIFKEGFDGTLNAIWFQKKYINLHYTHSQIEYPLMDTIRLAKVAGMKYLTFEYYAQDLTMDGTEDTTVRILTNGGHGSEQAVAITQSIYTEFFLTKEMEGMWHKIIIDIAPANPTYLANIMNEDNENFVIYLGGAVGGDFFIRNMTFGTAEDYAVEMEENYYDHVNYTDYEDLSAWQVSNGIDAYRDYYKDWGTLFMAKRNVGIRGDADHIEIAIMDEIREAKAEGKKLLTFEFAWIRGLYGEGANSPVLWVSANDGSGDASKIGVGYWITQQINMPSVENKYTKVYIDLTKNDMIDNTSLKYLSILVGGEYDGWVLIRNMKFEGEAEYNAIKYDITDYSDLSYMLGRVANTVWENDCGLEFDYDTSNSALIIKGRDTDAFHYGSSYIKIMDEIRDAIKAGKTKLSFEYYATNVVENSEVWVIATDGASKDKVTSSGLCITGIQKITAGAWTKIEIDLTASAHAQFVTNITNEANEYLGIVFGGDQTTEIKVREFKFA